MNPRISRCVVDCEFTSPRLGGDCAHAARRESLREAGRRYQCTRRGRFAHAARARRYRGRDNNVRGRAGYPTPPAQFRTGPIKASGSYLG